MQFLITLQFLWSQTKAVRETNNTLAESKNLTLYKPLLFTFVFTTEEEVWIEEARTRSMSLIEHSCPQGDIFAKTMQHLLQSEINWVRWKSFSCFSFEREPTHPISTPIALPQVSLSVNEKTSIVPLDPPSRYLPEEMGEMDSWKHSRQLRGVY